eukprot:3668797-Rhodomonas_salina.2
MSTAGCAHLSICISYAPDIHFHYASSTTSAFTPDLSLPYGCLPNLCLNLPDGHSPNLQSCMPVIGKPKREHEYRHQPTVVSYGIGPFAGCLPYKAWHITAVTGLTSAGPSVTDEQ